MFGGLWVFPGGRLDDDDGSLIEGDLAWRRAAAREAGEEVGVGVLPQSLVFLSRWITPSFAPRRYDTRFYICVLEGRPPLQPQVGEVEEARFVTATEALASYATGDWDLILPTLTHLRWLDRFSSSEEAVAGAACPCPRRSDRATAGRGRIMGDS
jgi:8-oxo-dGTP pyrophosphatase MutT (NUDIX family)